ncbi:hypothetical protein P7C70_g1883, partial [Phenoliferia sp. Uapishka_3]
MSLSSTDVIYPLLLANQPTNKSINKMGVIKITTSNDYQYAINGEGVSAIEFCAPWDEPSKAISPKFDSFSESDKFKALSFYRVDINDAQVPTADVAMDSGVKLAPQFHFYKDGAKVGEYIGSSYPALEVRPFDLVLTS